MKQPLLPGFEDPTKAATFSADRRYRYMLSRTWDRTLARVTFIGLNPSDADETDDDPTIRRCIGFAKQWGCGQLVMVNLFAFAHRDPDVMKAADDPVGPDNDATLLRYTTLESTSVVAAWGIHGKHRGRADAVKALLRDRRLVCLKKNKDGSPQHPLYLPYAEERREFP
jgi:hypothetical protein